MLRALIDGRAVYRPGSVEFRDSHGADLDLRRSFSIEDSPSEAGHFLDEAGFLHLRSAFTEDEMTALSAELDTALAEAQRDDGSSWWRKPRTANGIRAGPGVQPEIRNAASTIASRLWVG